ncbi:SLATT domain-containing protein [Streptomyces sp. NPDC046860]|uniref:SLATT domain-containing protein n=1 Tax=Streptomyces sp. NPDC046860 TaxID=3154495 RepID=UPI00340E773C
MDGPRLDDDRDWDGPGPDGEDGQGRDGRAVNGPRHGGREPGAPRPGDLVGRAMPLGDWGEPAERLDELYRWVEQGALRTADWYLADRMWRRRAARTLRAGTAAGVVAGVALPLLDATGAVSGCGPWGYLALLFGAACAGADRCFGLTSGWMRDMATAQAVGRRLQALQFDWASESAREMLGPAEGTAGEAAERCLGILRRFSEDVAEVVRTETTDWLLEFRTGRPPLSAHTALPAQRPDATAPAPRHFPPPNGARPHMPRQRPPESR